MFEYLTLNMWNDGTEHCTCYGSYGLDNRDIEYGTRYCLTNNHVKNTWKIEKWNTHTYIGVVARGKEETLDLEQFKKWLSKNNVEDAYMDWLRKNPEQVKSHPGICGAEFIW